MGFLFFAGGGFSRIRSVVVGYGAYVCTFAWTGDWNYGVISFSAVSVAVSLCFGN